MTEVSKDYTIMLPSPAGIQQNIIDTQECLLFHFFDILCSCSHSPQGWLVFKWKYILNTLNIVWIIANIDFLSYIFSGNYKVYV